MAFDIRTARPVSGLPSRIISPQSKGKFNISTARPDEAEEISSIIPSKEILLAGGLGRGAEAARKGARLQDLPYLVSKSFSGALGTLPERISERPVSAFTQVLPSRGKLFPKPATEEGEKLGGELEFLSGLIPVEAIGSRIVRTARPAVERAVKTAITDVPKGLKSARREGLKQLADRPAVIGRLQNITRKRGEKQLFELGENVKRESEVLRTALNKTATGEAQAAQEFLPSYYRKNFDIYEKGIDKIIETTKPKITRLKVSQALENSLNELGLRGQYARPSVSPSEQHLLNLAMEYADISKAKEIVPTETIIDISRQMKKTVSTAIRAGKQNYTSGEHAVTVFKENFGKVLEDAAPGLRELNQSYRPFFELKRQATSIFKPYAGKTETKTAEQFLKRYGQGALEGTGEEQFLRNLQSETGVKLGESTKQVGSQLRQLKEAKTLGQQRVKNITEQRLIELESKKRKLEREVPKTIAGALRTALRFGRGRFL